MAHSFLKQYSKQFRMIKVHYMDFEDRFHVKTFKDCSLIEASNVFDCRLMALYLMYYVYEYQ